MGIRPGRKAIISGEVVRNPTNPHAGDAFHATLDDDQINDLVRECRKGRKTWDVANEFGVSIESVKRWCKQADEKIQNALKAPREVRATLVGQLETVIHEAWAILRDNEHPAVKRDMLVRIESAVGSIAKLSGATSPARIKLEADVTMTETTQADIRLRELINEEAAKRAATLAVVEREVRGGDRT